MKTACLVSLALAVANLVATPANTQTLVYLGDLSTDISSLPAEPGTPCFLGNLRIPGALEPNGRDILSFYAEIDSAACGCVGGWMVSEIHILLANVSNDPVTFYFNAFVDGEGLNMFPTNCHVPHPGYWGELGTPSYNWVSFPGPGYYELIMTMDSLCALFGFEYFLKWSIDYADDPIRLVVDTDGARECEVLEGVHISEHWWWTDPHHEEWRLTSGAPIWWIEAACCDPPVRNDVASWSSVKALYR